MSRLEDALAQIEARLRALVEGGTSRLFMGTSWDDSDKCALAALLLQALHDRAEASEEGVALAPNQYTLSLSPAATQAVLADPEGLDELTSYLHQSGCEAGFRFMAFPTIEVKADSSLSREEMHLDAQIFPRHMGGTTAMLLQSEETLGRISSEAFLIVNGQWTFTLKNPVINIGRQADNDLVLNDPRISRTHAQLRLGRGRYTIFDLGSTGGTYVNGQRVTHGAALLPGDVISLAGVTLIFGHDSPADLDETTELLI